jgi:hypothetical protein
MDRLRRVSRIRPLRVGLLWHLLSGEIFAVEVMQVFFLFFCFLEEGVMAFSEKSGYNPKLKIDVIYYGVVPGILAPIIIRSAEILALGRGGHILRVEVKIFTPIEGLPKMSGGEVSCGEVA